MADLGSTDSIERVESNNYLTDAYRTGSADPHSNLKAATSNQTRGIRDSITINRLNSFEKSGGGPLAFVRQTSE